MTQILHDKNNPVPEDRFGDEFLVDPYPTYTYLRESGPLAWTNLYGGAWLAAGYDEVHEGLSSERLSADRSGVPSARLEAEVREQLRDWEDLFGRWLLFKDPPRHTELRRIVNRSFVPRVMDAWRPRIRELVVELLDEVGERDRVEFMTDFAYELPAAVIIEMLGVDRKDKEQYVSWSDDVAQFFGHPFPTPELAHRAQSSLLAMADYFRPYLAAADEEPKHEREPVVTILARAQKDDGKVDELDVLAQCTLFLFAGHETTRNLLGSGLYHLLRNPEQRRAVMDDPSLLKALCREAIRYESPIQFIHRLAVQSGEVCGGHVDQGDSIVLLLGAANRDPKAFVDPDRFDIFRADGSKQVAFGFGPHYCLGAPLANLEGEIAFEKVLQRWPNLRLVDPDRPDWSPQMPHFRNLQSLWVER